MLVIITGVIYGLGLAVLVGPVFFSLLKTSMKSGFRAGMYMALGVSLSETFAVALVYLGISQLMSNAWFELVLGGAGGLLMMIFGINTLIQNRKAHKKLKELAKKEDDENMEIEISAHTISKNNKNLRKNIPQKKNWQYLFDGFLLNAINPFIYIFWVGVMSSVLAKYNYNVVEMIIFLLTVISVVLFTDLLKAFFAKKLSHLLNPNTLSAMDKFIGIGLIIFGVHLWFRIWIGGGLTH